MCGTTYSSLQSSNTLNYRRMITHRASESVYCTTKHLLMVWVVWPSLRWAKGQGAGTADAIPKFLNRPFPFESKRTADSNSNLEASQVPNFIRGLGQAWTSAPLGGHKRTVGDPFLCPKVTLQECLQLCGRQRKHYSYSYMYVFLLYLQLFWLRHWQNRQSCCTCIGWKSHHFAGNLNALCYISSHCDNKLCHTVFSVTVMWADRYISFLLFISCQ